MAFNAGPSRRSKVLEYEEFLDKRLKPDLVQTISERDKILEQLKIYSDLATNIKLLEDNRMSRLRTMINLGSEIYCQADVPDTSRIFVDVGLGFHVEFTLAEASTFISTKTALLKSQADEKTKQVARIKSQIKLVYEGVRELIQLQQRDSI